MNEEERLTPRKELYGPMIDFVKRVLGEQTPKPGELAIIPGLVELLIEKFEYRGPAVPTKFASRPPAGGTRSEGCEELLPFPLEEPSRQSEAERS